MNFKRQLTNPNPGKFYYDVIRSTKQHIYTQIPFSYVYMIRIASQICVGWHVYDTFCLRIWPNMPTTTTRKPPTILINKVVSKFTACSVVSDKYYHNHIQYPAMKIYAFTQRTIINMRNFCLLIFISIYGPIFPCVILGLYKSK